MVFLDDLQWAGRTPLGFVDVLLSEEPVAGLLVVGAYRDAEVGRGASARGRCSRAGAPRRRPGSCTWRTCQPPSVVAMVADMLRVDPAAAAGLASAIERAHLGQSVRGRGVAQCAAPRRRADCDGRRVALGRGCRARALGRTEVARSVAASVPKMPPDTERVVEAMACLGGRAEVGVLRIATGKSAAEVDRRSGSGARRGPSGRRARRRVAVRFRHDRVREAVLSGLDTERRRALQLDLARRLVAVPELYAVAAEQYLPVIDAVQDATERRLVVAMLHRAADEAGLIGDHAMVEALMSAALRLVDVDDTAALHRACRPRDTPPCSASAVSRTPTRSTSGSSD